jgi:hypothetical protein
MARVTKPASIGGHEITLQRPTYMEFRSIAMKVDTLMGVEFDIAMSRPEFTEILQACTVGDIEPVLAEMDFADAARLWDEVVAFCEFPAFFAERRKQHFERSKERMETEVDLQAAQFSRMKKRGLLPESFSLDSVMSGANPLAGILTSSPSSPTITPTTTDGDAETSSGRTSGLSSVTSQKRSGAAKR